MGQDQSVMQKVWRLEEERDEARQVARELVSRTRPKYKVQDIVGKYAWLRETPATEDAADA